LKMNATLCRISSVSRHHHPEYGEAQPRLKMNATFFLLIEMKVYQVGYVSPKNNKDTCTWR
jgi:hypothetical protein